ncbi:putative cyclic nucleotide-gated ion channel 14 [Morella rubra]|uniref:Putative cyclic nucleotide-gated ion channel 14 n=1 Tax=Morella rubra TaxID=262757 RepID=A0A6A1UXN3_9ROSI|nr:putative cyclic nucleotide-gated ion channel 14 [Morella rubra]
MEYKKVRFYSDEKQNLPPSGGKNDAQKHLEKPLPVYKVSAPLLKPEGGGVGHRNQRTSHKLLHKGILDPRSNVVLRWNRVFLFFCMVALFVDPIFFYLPVVNNDSLTPTSFSCMTTDLSLGVVITCFRTVADVFYVLHMVLKFRTAYVSKSSRVFGRGELIRNQKMIARRYLRSEFSIDLVAALPLPQIVIWFVLPAIKRSQDDHTDNTLVLIVLLQYIPRLYLIFPLSSQIIKATGVVTQTAWAGAAYNLLLYMLASHVIGASWYLLSFERYAHCWKLECKNEISPLKCHRRYLGCDSLKTTDFWQWANATAVFSNCNPANTSISFNFGIFKNAVTNNVVSTSFMEKYLYCLWFGLQNLSSYGQNLTTSTFLGETSFSILVCVMGLVLFAQLIGNMQTYLQSITVRLEEWRLKRRDTEEWMRHRQLPPGLQERVRKFTQYKWLATRGVDEESILSALPTDLRRDIQRHLCLDLLLRGTYIVREGDPVTEMLFIIRGRLDSSTTNGGRTGFFNSITLRPGDFCGEELLAWALLPKCTLNLPSSTRTTPPQQEAAAHIPVLFSPLEDLGSMLHTGCLASVQEEVDGERSRHAGILCLNEKEVDEKRHEKEERFAVCSILGMQAKQNLGVTILASRFAANTRRGAQKSKGVQLTTLQKPEEPDFSMEPEDD